jgi:hypothetical protein
VPAPILSARLRETSVEVRWRFARRTTSAACRPGLIVLNLHAIRRDYGREIAVRARSGRILIPFDGGDLPHRLSAEVRAADGPGVNYASKRVR